ncbi:serine/threonine-protein kinase [Tuwongella immobilis]|uniref:non-specific serine/threonine protein kinase n=1 Tax=Tuwongella immobilis TaxID=692036 RepID=A0A6C2YW62_9BACT|nr:serine/threonine-protein kinase [Tuwongella immobilis]VIP05631.1 serine threonine protein kinase : Tetratricopeptide repeat protein,protein kinase family protein OS=Singulisphaera acidiphila (strain ATCC BAA-1392 / DSM 18658 / VKM B-2454 / MOB10) GN=Sinac_4434 PE=3 SV=1: Pkinase [Tuwongella immobilis]VTS08618.1 serine threonine protein kinase : Tetratricopeptide repeat protein,protein kinase family protein OS=Singulisphaera acidiphila (strain ATCC BAA-1392 / DSM 18658 / VKM B-2454 / MOB10) GN=
MASHPEDPRDRTHHTDIQPVTRESAESEAGRETPLMVPSLQRLPTSLIPGYELLHEIGRGGMGIVYQARHLESQQLVAIKLVPSHQHTFALDRQRFQIEIETMSRIQHPNIVRLHESGEIHSLPYMVMEHCPHGSLQTRIEHGPMPAHEAAKMMAAIAQGVQCAHDAGVIHRDLKPANILMGVNLIPKVADFGLARRIDSADQVTRKGAIIGSLSYMAPEQAAGHAHDATAQTDIYALGAMLYTLLIGQPPFRGENDWETLERIMQVDPPPLRSLKPQIPEDLAAICHHCLEKQPLKRYRSAEDLARDLEAFLANAPISVRPLPPMQRLIRAARAYPRSVISGTLVCLTMMLISLGLNWNVQRAELLVSRVHDEQLPVLDDCANLRFRAERLVHPLRLAIADSRPDQRPHWHQLASQQLQHFNESLNALAARNAEPRAVIQELAIRNQRLIQYESHAWSAIMANRLEQARAIVNSPEYISEQLQFRNQLHQFTDQLRRKRTQVVEDVRSETQQFRLGAAVLAAIPIMIILVGIVVLLRMFRR